MADALVHQSLDFSQSPKVATLSNFSKVKVSLIRAELHAPSFSNVRLLWNFKTYYKVLRF